MTTRGSKRPLNPEEVAAIVLPHGGERTTAWETLTGRATYFWNGPRGRACCVHVFSGERNYVSGHRCGKIAAVTETVKGVDLDFCAFHASAAVAKRAAVQQAKWDPAEALQKARSDEVRARANKLADADRWRAALQLIADGDNDPRRTAMTALGIEPAPEVF